MIQIEFDTISFLQAEVEVKFKNYMKRQVPE